MIEAIFSQKKKQLNTLRKQWVGVWALARITAQTLSYKLIIHHMQILKKVQVLEVCNMQFYKKKVQVLDVCNMLFYKTGLQTL